MPARFTSGPLIGASCVLALAPLLTLALLACNETPRGEQGIDFLDEAGIYTVPSNDAGTDDAPRPCAENDDAGVCAPAVVQGTPAPHLIVCKPGNVPIDLSCVTPDGSGSDAAFCCTTGLL